METETETKRDRQRNKVRHTDTRLDLKTVKERER